MRQSAGKRVKNKLATTSFANPAIESLAWPWVARIRNSLLLKTALPQPGTLGRQSGYRAKYSRAPRAYAMRPAGFEPAAS